MKKGNRNIIDGEVLNHPRYHKIAIGVISYRKPATVAHKFIRIKKLASKCTAFQCHRNKFKFYRPQKSSLLSNLKKQKDHDLGVYWQTQLNFKIKNINNNINSASKYMQTGKIEREWETSKQLRFKDLFNKIDS